MNKLGTKYQDLLEYNLNTPNRAEPIILLVIYDFPGGMDGRCIDTLINILRNGNKCGVYTLICHNPGVTFSRYESIEDRMEQISKYCIPMDYKEDVYKRQLPVQPRLKDIAQKMMPILEQAYGSYENCARRGFGLGLPHIYRNNFGRNEEYFICTADPKYFKAGQTRSTSAASALSWACKWIMLCEMWLNGEISDDVALEGNY